ncbi:hypothetical protein EFK50_07905 [Nocardioides marmoriginsengisoli]|uniref:Uncharacterized protein n=1 Tax=Nocardioides marmoriginsengisoli TaxID=661483 RepID=A0A3N0CJL9_9ACTN|nr:hypothetical protein [Nocardioides marmoriginsengisoli]RNL63658.1 hypothetical protein EFK50_07905 [Nocardioides marmoriginsengisoli]
MKIPQRSPRRQHSKPDWRSDSPRAAKAAGKSARRGGSPYTDINTRPLLDGAGCIHDGTPRKGGWRYLAVGKGKRRALTRAELDRPFEEWSRKDFVRLRRTKRPGIRYVTRVRPYLYAEMLAIHQRNGAIMCAEIKKAFPRRTAELMARTAKRLDMPPFVMTLVHQGYSPPKPGYSMAVAGEKLRTFHATGAQTALLTHGYPVPVDLDTWRPFIDAYWGANAERFRP